MYLHFLFMFVLLTGIRAQDQTSQSSSDDTDFITDTPEFTLLPDTTTSGATTTSVASSTASINGTDSATTTRPDYPVVTVFGLNASDNEYFATVVNANVIDTTYSVRCLTSESFLCPTVGRMSLTAGPAFIRASYNYYDGTESQGETLTCGVTGTTAANCSYGSFMLPGPTVTGAGQQYTNTSYAISTSQIPFARISIVEGASKLATASQVTPTPTSGSGSSRLSHMLSTSSTSSDSLALLVMSVFVMASGSLFFFL